MWQILTKLCRMRAEEDVKGQTGNLERWFLYPLQDKEEKQNHFVRFSCCIVTPLATMKENLRRLPGFNFLYTVLLFT